MDDGTVIPALNEPYTLLGARIMDWGNGVVAGILTPEVLGINPSKGMPVVIGMTLFIAFGSVALRKKFPDEEVGMRNAGMTALGIAPPGIPAPSQLQPVWSGAPMREIDEGKDFMKLGLTEIFPHGDNLDEEEDDDALMYLLDEEEEDDEDLTEAA